MIHRAFEEPNPAPVKAALAMMGQMRDELRSPMQAASADMREALRKELRAWIASNGAHLDYDGLKRERFSTSENNT